MILQGPGIESPVTEVDKIKSFSKLRKIYDPALRNRTHFCQNTAIMEYTFISTRNEITLTVVN
ncbi:hypothetical protein GCM10011506_32510 [Marivirga lumbricoides]|uniref:Uncharacterized protein n=1 Tax=Marivirga lumbricoides TaxID=1046115 RepID=A0ABQ1MWN5_9BACT|nr:hypothetical protein GCM10011506_32510 [Marivirga lumbricoides]